MEGEEADKTNDEGKLVGVRQHPKADANLGEEEDHGTKDRDSARRNGPVLAPL